MIASQRSFTNHRILACSESDFRKGYLKNEKVAEPQFSKMVLAFEKVSAGSLCFRIELDILEKLPFDDETDKVQRNAAQDNTLCYGIE